ncbi:MAG: hypothetical protein ABTQ26_05675 [Azonexus sp.]
MRKTPSYLKGLAETRARAAAEVQRYSALAAEVQLRLAEAQAALDSCDRLIVRFDPRLDPTTIEPIFAHKGRYGKHGALSNTVLAVVQEAYPREINTTEVAVHVQLRLAIDFETPVERGLWVDSSLRNALKQLYRRKLIERLHDPAVKTGAPGIWRGVAPSGIA